jgi:PAS domain S-box-containing protein
VSDRDAIQSLRAAFDQASIGRTLTGPDGRLARVNQALCAMLGYPAAELERMSFADITHPDDMASSRECIRALLEGERQTYQLEKRYLHRDGRVVWTSVNATLVRDADGAPLYFVTDIIDITERKRAEAALRRSESKYRSLVEGSLQGVVIAQDAPPRLTFANPAMAEITGFSPDELLAMGPEQIAGLIHPDDQERFFATFRSRLADHSPPARSEYRHLRKDGSVGWVLAYSNAIDYLGQPATLTAFVDITEAKRAAEELAQSEARARAMYRHLPFPTFIWQRQGGDFVFSDCNAAAERLTGATIRNWIGKNLNQVHTDRPDVIADIERCFAEQQTIQREMQFRYSDTGEEKLLLVTYAPVPPDTVLVHTEDRTEQRRTEEKLRVSQRLEAVGQLAGGVAHDFNNYLTVINSYARFARDAVGAGDPVRADLEQILAAGQRATELTGQLLAFSRRQLLEPEVLDPGRVIAGLETMLRRLLGEHIAVTIDTETASGSVRADPGQLEQVIVNLAVNARDAMPDGGSLRIATGEVELDRGRLERDFADSEVDARPGPYVELAVSDTGCGMDAETLAHIFEPFFTTKDAAKGSGLGLATVYGIVAQSGGLIAVDSRLGGGSCFRVYLPRVEPRQVEQPQPTAAWRTDGHEAVLVVEDEPAVRDITERILRRAGYRVLAAADGQQALRLLEGGPLEFDLLLTDVIMPQISGPELAARLSARNPALRVLYMSGYTDDAIVHHGVLDGETQLISKPFSAEDLLAKVRTVLDADRPPRP